MFKSVLALAALVASVAAQGVIIKDPTPYTTLHAGQTIVVDVDRTVSTLAPPSPQSSLV